MGAGYLITRLAPTSSQLLRRCRPATENQRSHLSRTAHRKVLSRRTLSEVERQCPKGPKWAKRQGHCSHLPVSVEFVSI